MSESIKARLSAVRVLKLGGSLLDWPAWPAQLRGWLATQSPAHYILIVGGGALADVVRGWDRIHRLDSETAHWLAIDAMSVAARMTARLLDAQFLERWEALVERLSAPNSRGANSPQRGGLLLVFDPRDFLQRIEPKSSGRRLPHGWQVTSDSIAARLALILGTEIGESVELVLLKSALPLEVGITLTQAAVGGYVDMEFPNFAGSIESVRCVNLRAASWPELSAAQRN